MDQTRSELEQALAETVEAVIDFLESSRSADSSVTDRLEPDQIRAAIDLDLPEDGTPLTELVPFLRSYLKHSTKTGHVRFLNQLFGGIDAPGLLAELVTAAGNTSMYTYEVAPVATIMEKDLVQRMSRMVGFEDGEGILVTGGSNANLMAMLYARHRHNPDARHDGIGDTRYDAFVSEEAHYSLLIAANLLGIGANSVVQVESDDHGRMIPEKLDEAIERSKMAGRTPFFVAATAGTTVLGAFDPLPRIAAIARHHGIWMHVDGAWGAPIVFSEKHRHLIHGCHLADSFAWDAHKLMGVPLTCTAILLREKGQLSSAVASSGTEYIYHDNPSETQDLGPMSIACGRKVDSLKLWLAWKHHGVRGYEKRIDKLMQLAGDTRRKIDAHPRLELMAEPSYLNLCFRYVPTRSASAAEVDELNRRARDRMAEAGQALVNYAYIGDRVTIRLVLPNVDLTLDVLEGVLEDLVETAMELEGTLLGPAGTVDDSAAGDTHSRAG